MNPSGNPPNYVTRVHASPLEVNAQQWNALLAASDAPTPFMRHEYLAALHTSGSACEATGWLPQFVSLYSQRTENEKGQLLASAPMYLKDHSYGEYIFDHAWARAYQEHGLRYYPKAVVAVPYTPVPGTRFLCQSGLWPKELLHEQLQFCEQNGISSLHALFTSTADKAACDAQPLMARQTVQFHWTNAAPAAPISAPTGTTESEPKSEPYGSFDHYLSTLAQDKRKKIRAERRKVLDAGITWRTIEGAAISPSDWAFFYRCYERTYLEHGNAPYLTPAFFEAMASTMPENWVMFIAEHSGQPIACSLIAVNSNATNTVANCAAFPWAISLKHIQNAEKIAYGRYWGALARVDSLHFEACYYQPLEWCIQNGYHRFEGGAQGEHKMARGLLPITAHSAHWLAHPQFANAVARFLEREGAGMENYMEHLERRSPFRV
jgi:predicted N-acyltransferase